MKLKYKAIKEGETIDISVAFSQTAALLDAAAKKSLYENDAKLMLEVADRWIAIGSLLADDSETKEVAANEKSSFGFCPGGDENE